MLKLREFTETEKAEFPQILKKAKTQKTIVYIRIQAIALLHAGKKPREVAEVLGICENSVRSCLKRFNTQGFAGLAYRWGGGPKIKLGSLDKAFWEDLLSRPPSHFPELETQAQNWTYVLLQRYLQLVHNLKVGQSTIWLHLRRIKFTAGRAKLSVTSPDPEYQVKRQRIETLEKKLRRRVESGRQPLFPEGCWPFTQACNPPASR